MGSANRSQSNIHFLCESELQPGVDIAASILIGKHLNDWWWKIPMFQHSSQLNPHVPPVFHA